MVSTLALLSRPTRLLLVGMVCLAGGCQTFDHYNPAVEQPVPPPLTPPREQRMVSAPGYQVEPPDLLRIEVLKMVPRPPYRAATYDVLQVQVIGTLLDQPIDGFYLVEAEGVVDLGPAYGKVRVAGMTIDETTAAITEQLEKVLRQPEVSVKLARASGMQPISGIYLVGPDGTVNLRQYGRVHVAGQSLAEVRERLEAHLGQFLDAPEVAVDVAQANSKSYYVITEGPGLGDSVQRLPFSGNDTVLDAVGQIGSLSQISGTDIWIARPAPGDTKCARIMPVDWEAVASGASTETNYQILPGDRVFIAADKPTVLATMVGQIVGPAQEVAGYLSLQRAAISSLQRLGRQNLRRTGF